MARMQQGVGPLALLLLTLFPMASQATETPLLRGELVASSYGFEAAPPFRLTAMTDTRDRARTCLATAVYYESANQPTQGQAAVAQVILNRMRHPAFPKSVCGVVYEGAAHKGCQFTFACDGSLAHAPVGGGWRAALAIADQALDGYVERSVGASTHYHTTAVHPLWSATMTPTRQIGAHQFYRFPGVWGGVSMLEGVYAGAEPEINLARSAQATSNTAPLRRTIALAHPASFSVWGLQVAMVRAGGAVIMSGAADGDSKTRPMPLGADASGF